MKLKLNKEKIKKLKELHDLSWQDIADMGNLNSRQNAFAKYANGGVVKSAEFFGKIFNMRPKDLIE